MTPDGARRSHGLDAMLAIWHRRKWIVLITFVTVLGGTLATTRSLPDIYEAKASVLVEHPQVAERFVGPAAGGGMETRLQTITQELLSRSRLAELIERFDLYPDVRAQAAPHVLADRMRSDIRVNTTEARQRAGEQATIAFAISYRGRDPDVVVRVTNALAELYVERNATIRERQTSGTLELLRAQLDDVKGRLDERERQLGEFKSRYAGELAEQQMANLAALERLNAQLRLNIDRQLRVMERRDELAAEIAGGPAAGGAVPGDPLSMRIAELRAELAALRTRFTDEHPDVIRLRTQIAALEAERSGTARAPAGAPAPDGRTRRLRDVLSRTEAELAALRDEEAGLRRTIAVHQQRIENAPRREQELQHISRDYDALRELYNTLLQRYQDAQLAERVEQRQQGEQFRLLDPAVPSRQPLAPNRMTLLFMGLLLAGGSAAGVGLLAESRDTSFHSADDLREFTTVPVLASIPPIVTAPDTRRARARFWLGAAAAAGWIAAVGGAAMRVAHDNEMLVRLLTPGRF